ncbi:YcxB family protein [Actinoplanes sp. NPDC048796]|uniref:YcxB family protein n=1 Tax=unclassified Actinoplanes TaxID=2626549 RepID=UPI0033C767E6
MFLQITARPDPRLVATALRHGLRRPVLIARVAGWAAIALAALHVLTGSGLDIPLLAVGALLAVGVPLLLITTGTRRSVDAGHLTTYEISDSGVALSTLESRHAYAWTAFTTVAHLPHQLVFARSRARFLPIPTTGLTPAQIDQVLGTAARHGLQIHHSHGTLTP